MSNKYVLFAGLLMLFVVMSYVGNFYFKLNYVVSNDAAVWGQLGDYVGGLLNPMLSFISIVLLIKSLTLQNQANMGLIEEIEIARKTEKMRSFEMQLFNMIDSQMTSFDSLKIEVEVNGETVVKYGAEAVIAIEDEIERLRDQQRSDEEIVEFIESIDPFDKIYGVTRIFYVMVKMVVDKLGDSEGFCQRDRKSHLLTVINFTDFALLRLIMMSMQFMEYPSTDYLKGSADFNDVLAEVGLSYSLY